MTPAHQGPSPTTMAFEQHLQGSSVLSALTPRHRAGGTCPSERQALVVVRVRLGRGGLGCYRPVCVYRKYAYLCVCMYTFACISLYVCIRMHVCVCVCVYISIYLPIHPSIHLSICLSVCLFVCLSVCLSIYLSVCPSVCTSVCLPVHLRPSVRPSVRPAICQSQVLTHERE